MLKSYARDSSWGTVHRAVTNRLLEQKEGEEKALREKMAELAKLLLTTPEVRAGYHMDCSRKNANTCKVRSEIVSAEMGEWKMVVFVPALGNCPEQ